MPGLLNGRVIPGATFVGLNALAGTMMITNQSEPSSAPTEMAAPPVAAASAPVANAPAKPAARDGFVIRRILPISGPIKYDNWHWDETGVPPGPIVVTVDLDAQVISVFRNGYEIGAAAVLLGTQDKPTPLGVFPIMEKQVHHAANLYDAEMPYMQRLTNDGITLHATKVA